MLNNNLIKRMVDSEPTNWPNEREVPRKCSESSASSCGAFLSAEESKRCTHDGTTQHSSTHCEAVEDERAFEL